MWIEIVNVMTALSETESHASHEACGLKLIAILLFGEEVDCHASHEACGLKSVWRCLCDCGTEVTPRMRRVD